MNSPSIITLRPFRLTDADDIMLWVADDRVTINLRWKTITSKEAAFTFIREVCIPHPWQRSICIDDRSIGLISIFPGSGDDRCRADIRYCIAVTYGITTKAVQMALSQFFKDFSDVLRLQAYANAENKASQRVLEKAGFLKEGLRRKYSYLEGNLQDLVVYSFLSTDTIIADP